MFRPINSILLALAATMIAPAATAPRATADHFCYNGCCDMNYMRPVQRARWYNWNRNYAYTDYGVPVALVVPPTANMQTHYGWGVASSRITRIDHQFQRNYSGYSLGGPFGGPYRPTPIWPSDTSQFGVYYVRGPW